MKSILPLLKQTIGAVHSFLSSFAKKGPTVERDAVLFPHAGEKELVEDYEMAAYHNQA